MEFPFRLSGLVRSDGDLGVPGGSQSGAAQYTLTVGSTNADYAVSQKINCYSFIKLATVDLPVGQAIVRLAPSADGPVSADIEKLVGVSKPATKYASTLITSMRHASSRMPQGRWYGAGTQPIHLG